MNIVDLNTKYINYISWLDKYVENLNKINDQSLNIHIENTIIRLLNLTYGYSLQNANMNAVNAKAIDGIDVHNRIAVQITSTTGFGKISNTLTKFIDDSLEEQYDQLLIFFIRKKKTISEAQLSKINEITGGRIQFDDSNLLDFFSVLDVLSSDYERLVSAVELLVKEIPYLENRLLTLDKVTVGISLPKMMAEDDFNKVVKMGNIFVNSHFQLYTSNAQLKQAINTDNVTLVENKSKLPRLDLCLVVLDNSSEEEHIPNCFIINKSLEGQTSIQNVAFEKIYINANNIINTRCYKLIKETNLETKIYSIISNLSKKNEQKTKNRNHANELIEIYGSFEHTLLNKTKASKKYYSYHFFKDDDATKKFLEIKKNVSSFEQVRKEFRNDFPDDTNFTVLVHKNEMHKSDRRLTILKKLFNVKYCEYISDKIGKTVKRKFKQNPLLQSNFFIEPMITDSSVFGQGNVGMSELLDWFNKENSPILFLIGQGGIGKTTVCKKLHDELISDDKIVLYINANDLISEIKNNSFNIGKGAYELYSFYTKWFPKAATHNSQLSRNAFYTNLSNGNIKIIFDGLDEIISSKPSFDMSVFLNYIEEELAGISHLAKIVISMRDYQYKLLSKTNQIDLSANYDTYTLELFTDEMAKEYFDKKFEHTPKVNRECLEVISSFNVEKEQYKYPPYLLFLISKIIPSDDVSIVDKGVFIDEEDFDFDKKLIFDSILLEYLNRELGKKNFIGLGVEVVDQLKMLEDFAYDLSKSFSKEEANRVVQKIKKQNYSEEFFRKLQDHPYLSYDENRKEFNFQFGFLRDHLRARKIKYVIQNKIKREKDVRLVGEYLKPQTILFKHLRDRVRSKPSIVYSYLKDLVALRLDSEKISEYNYLDIEDAISNLFQLCLDIVGKGKTVADYNKVLLQIFETEKNSKVISGMVLKDCPHGHAIVFDFSDLIITKSVISNYSRFFQCTFNENTLVTNDCNLNQIVARTKELTAKMSNFEEGIAGDKTFLDVLLRKDNSYSELNNVSIKSFKKILSFLSQKGDYVSYNRIKRSYLSDRKYNDHILDLTLDILLGKEILVKDKRSYKIVKSELDNVNMFVENTYLSRNIADAIRQFLSHIGELKD